LSNFNPSSNVYYVVWF